MATKKIDKSSEDYKAGFNAGMISGSEITLELMQTELKKIKAKIKKFETSSKKNKS